MRISLFLIYLLITSTNIEQGYSQVNTDYRVLPKSPEVEKFQEFTGVPINYNDGSLNFSIPIFTIEYAGMQVPISLHYNSNGIKVEEISSIVGLGWTLNMGGTVSRMIKGAPDEGNPYTAGFLNGFYQLDLDGYYQDFGLSKLNSELNKFESGNLNDPFAIRPRYIAFNQFIKDASKGLKDSQPDLFYFTNQEGSEKFIFSQNREISFLSETDFKIEEFFSPNNFNYWRVTSPKGIEYQYGKESDIPTNLYNTDNAVELAYVSQVGEFTNRFLVNAWFLTRMKNNRNNKEIRFNYINNNFKDVFLNKPIHESNPCLAYTTNNPTVGECDPIEVFYKSFAKNPYSNSSGETFQFLSNPKFLEKHTVSKVIDNINAGKISINFNYGTRDDLLPELNQTPKRLEGIDIYYDNKCVKQFLFNYSYSESVYEDHGLNESYNQSVRKRLILNSLEEISCTTSKSRVHSFEYDSNQLPNRLSFAKDKWGYFNGKNSNNTLFTNLNINDTDQLADRSVVFDMAKAQVLTKVIYPTNGYSEIFYEKHQTSTPVDYSVSDDIDNYLIGNITPNSNPNGNSYSRTFIMPEGNFYLRLKGSMTYNPRGNPGGGSCSISGTAVEIFDTVTNERIASIGYSGISPQPSSSLTKSVFIDSKKLVSGRTYRITVWGKGYRNECLTVSASVVTIPIIPNYDVGGMRVKQISYKDTDDSELINSNFSYFNPKLINDPKPIHKSEFDFVNVYYSLSPILDFSNVDYLNKCLALSSNTGIDYSKGYFYTFSPGFEPFEISFNGPDITYSKVVHSNNLGFNLRTFRSYKKYDEIINSGEDMIYPPIPVLQETISGALTNSTFVDEMGERKQQDSLRYNYIRTTLSSSPGIVTIGSIGNLDASLFNFYYLGRQDKKVINKSVTKFEKNKEIVSNLDYEYNSSKHNFLTKLIQSSSDNSFKSTEFYYAPDLFSNLHSLNLENRISNPVLIENFLSETNTEIRKFLSSIKYGYTSNLQTSNLALISTIETSKDNGSYQVDSRFDKYDDHGNILQATNRDGNILISYIYSYNKMYPVAKIEHATFSEVAAALGKTEEQLKNFNESEIPLLDTLRSDLPEAMVTTYTYEPLVGMTSMTDPKGYTIHYKYDGFNRLEYVKDDEGNILNKNEYNYAND